MLKRYKKPESRKPVNETMKHLTPGLLQMFSKLMQDDSNPSFLMQKQLVKIFYAFMQVSFDVSSRNVCFAKVLKTFV